MTGNMHGMRTLQFFIMLTDQKSGPRGISLGLIYSGYHVKTFVILHTFPKIVGKVSALMCIWTNLIIVAVKIRFGAMFA